MDIISDIEYIEETDEDSSDEENGMEAVSVVAVHQLESQYNCINCKKAIHSNEIGLATCNSCGTIQKVNNKKLTAKLFVQSETDNTHTSLRAYTTC